MCPVDRSPGCTSRVLMGSQRHCSPGFVQVSLIPWAHSQAGGAGSVPVTRSVRENREGRLRSAGAIAGIGLVDTIAATVRHVEKRGRRDGRLGASIDDVLLVLGMLKEDLPGGVGVNAALAATDRLAVDSDLTRLHDHHYYARVRVPARKTAGRKRVLRCDDVVAFSLLDPEGVIGLSAPDQHAGEPGPGVRAGHGDRARHEPAAHEPHQCRSLTDHRCLPYSSGVAGSPHGPLCLMARAEPKLAFREHAGACTSTSLNQRISSSVPSDAAEDEALYGDPSPGSLRGAWRLLRAAMACRNEIPRPWRYPLGGAGWGLRPAQYTSAHTP